MIIAPRGRGWAAIVHTKEATEEVRALLFRQAPEDIASKERKARFWQSLRKQAAHGPAVRLTARTGA